MKHSKEINIMNQFRKNTYKDYLSTSLSLTLDEMESIYSDMIINIDADEDATELYQDVLEQAIAYVNYRVKFALWDNETRLENDKLRSSCHDTLIIRFNVLARYLKSRNFSTEWRDALGDENADPYVRKRIGDFACYMVFVNGLGER